MINYKNKSMSVLKANQDKIAAGCTSSNDDITELFFIYRKAKYKKRCCLNCYGEFHLFKKRTLPKAQLRRTHC